MIKQLTEEDFYSLESGKDIGIFYYVSSYPRWYCAVYKKNRKPTSNIWNNEVMAFNWMKRVEECFYRC